MIVSELEKAIIKAKDEGKVPFYINTTAATTVLGKEVLVGDELNTHTGSYDDFDAIADVAEKYGE